MLPPEGWIVVTPDEIDLEATQRGATVVLCRGGLEEGADATVPAPM
jgi:hypothetical protein